VQISIVAGASFTMMANPLTIVDGIRQHDGAGELQNSFDSAPNCQELQPSER
jgi:hypothetical protein